MNRPFARGDPLPTTLAYSHTDKRRCSATLGRYHIVSASARGKLHVSNNTPRDDAIAIRAEGEWLAVAVADGVGSRQHSRYGAAFTVNQLCSRLIEAVGTTEKESKHDITLDAFLKTRLDLQQFALKSGASLNDLACTLLGMVLNIDTGVMGIGQIGDGLVLGLTETQEALPLIEFPIPDELGATYVLTQDTWARYFRSVRLSGDDARRFVTFYMMTDGVADDCLYGPPADILQRWANDMDREIRLVPNNAVTARRLERYLATYEAKGSFDDRTLVVIFKDKADRGF